MAEESINRWTQNLTWIFRFRLSIWQLMDFGPDNVKQKSVIWFIALDHWSRRKIFISHRHFSSTHCTLYHIIWSFFERKFEGEIILWDKFWTERAFRKMSTAFFSKKKGFLVKFKFIYRSKRKFWRMSHRWTVTHLFTRFR